MKNISDNTTKEFVASLCLTIGFAMEICACTFVPCAVFQPPYLYHLSFKVVMVSVARC